MSSEKSYNEYLKNYFEDRPALQHFGECFIKAVFDPSITRFLDAYKGNGDPRFAEAVKKYIETFSDTQLDSLEKLTKAIIYDALSAMLDMFVLYPEMSIIVEQDGKKIDILEISDSFCNDMIGENGCIEIFGKYANDFVGQS